MRYVLLVGFKLRKYHFCEEVLDLEQGETTFQNTLKIAYFAIRFFNSLLIYMKKIVARVQTHLNTLHNPT